MRRATKGAIVSVLIAATMLTLPACGTKPEDTTQPAQTTQEFVETSADKWVNSNYQKHWFTPDDAVYELAIKELTPTGTEYEEHKVYTDKEGKEVVLIGNDVIAKEDLNTEVNLDEKTGRMIYRVSSQADKDIIITDTYSGTNRVNGKLVDGKLVIMIDEVKMLDLTSIAQAAFTGLTITDTGLTIGTHTLPQCDQKYVDTYSIDKLQTVVDKDGNMYYSPLKTNDHIYVTPMYAKHVLGWDIELVDDFLTVWLDEIYKPTEEYVRVFDQVKAQKEQEARDKAILEADQAERSDAVPKGEAQSPTTPAPQKQSNQEVFEDCMEHATDWDYLDANGLNSLTFEQRCAILRKGDLERYGDSFAKPEDCTGDINDITGPIC